MCQIRQHICWEVSSLRTRAGDPIFTMEVLRRAADSSLTRVELVASALQDAVQTVAGDVAALQALAAKALQTEYFATG